MRQRLRPRNMWFSVGIILASSTATLASEPLAPLGSRWTTVVNNNDVIPGVSPARTFNSYNQPSVNTHGLVVFRARSRGGVGLGPATHGIYTRAMAESGAPVERVLDRATPVPYPNNLGMTFIETPSFPRIDMDSDTIVTRGNHEPVWTYVPPGELESTRVGTTGAYVQIEGVFLTGATKLGVVPGFERFAVPGFGPGTFFDVFPGAPAVTEATLVFKGNFTSAGLPGTGVFYRDLDVAPVGGDAPVVLIAKSGTTRIPRSEPPAFFGSTSPPSAADGLVVFAGFDDEAAPSLGGLYLAPLVPEPLLQPLVEIGARVPGESWWRRFDRLGEGASFDGRYVGFWGAWGSETKSVRLYCPEEGNKDRIAYCNHTGVFADGTGDPNSVCDDATDGTERCYQERAVPVHQGIFVHDVRARRTLELAKTGDGFDDFLFWNYSGKVPGVGGGHGDEGGEADGEPVRWRSTAFLAVAGTRFHSFRVAFKAATDDAVGIYLARGPGRFIVTLVDTTMAASVLDDEAPAGARIVEVGLEREGLRRNWLVINARMGIEGGSEAEGMAGIYLTQLGWF